MVMHSFDVSLAEEYGILEAVIINNMRFWIEHNMAQDINFYEGRYWTYNSRGSLGELFPYAGPDKVRRAIDHLVESGILMKGCFNKKKFDRTNWYSFTDDGFLAVGLGKSAQTDWANMPKQSGQICPTNTRYKPDIEPYNSSLSPVFKKPKVEEVAAYCSERKNSIDAQRFCDYYESCGWKVGKKPMKDWKAAVRTWERRNNGGNEEFGGYAELL